MTEYLLYSFGKDQYSREYTLDISNNGKSLEKITGKTFEEMASKLKNEGYTFKQDDVLTTISSPRALMDSWTRPLILAELLEFKRLFER